MNISNWIQLVAVVVTLLTSIIAIIISVKSLKLTKKSIEDANKPYIVIYEERIHVASTIHPYLIVKNFGKTGAVINYINFYPKFGSDREPFGRFKKVFIAPGQSYTWSIFRLGEDCEVREVVISYTDNNKKEIVDKIILNHDASKSSRYTKSQYKSNDLNSVVTTAAEELLRHKL